MRIGRRAVVLGSLVGIQVIAAAAYGALVVKMEKPNIAGQKADVRLELKNTFGERIESVRASVFLLDAQGKMVGQMTRWVIGGSKDKPALAPGGIAHYDFVVPAIKPFARTKLMVNRVVLEGRKLADVMKEVTIEGN
jgi:hypothetical protein